MSKSTDRINLTNQFLIAMPNMADPTFSGTVVYLRDHSERGALGLVINRPTDIDLKRSSVASTSSSKSSLSFTCPGDFGGPVQTERGFVLHDPKDGNTYTSSMSVPGGLEIDHAERRARGGRKRHRSRTFSAHARPRRLGRGPTRRRDFEERLAHRRGRSENRGSTCPPKSASKPRSRCSASRCPCCRARPGHA